MQAAQLNKRLEELQGAADTSVEPLTLVEVVATASIIHKASQAVVSGNVSVGGVIG